MSDRIPWIERKFNFDFPVELHNEILERLRGTPARVEERVREVPRSILTMRDAPDTWSIQENVGHLATVERLFMKRLDDYDAGAATLRPADMSNQKTHEARHNESAMESVLQAFRQVRGDLVERFEQYGAGRFARTARHPRLDRSMRVVDMMYFLAEHDDYHMARITQLAGSLGVERGG